MGLFFGDGAPAVLPRTVVLGGEVEVGAELGSGKEKGLEKVGSSVAEKYGADVGDKEKLEP